MKMEWCRWLSVLSIRGRGLDYNHMKRIFWGCPPISDLAYISNMDVTSAVLQHMRPALQPLISKVWKYGFLTPRRNQKKKIVLIAFLYFEWWTMVSACRFSWYCIPIRWAVKLQYPGDRIKTERELKKKRIDKSRAVWLSLKICS